MLFPALFCRLVKSSCIFSTVFLHEDNTVKALLIGVCFRVTIITGYLGSPMISSS